MEEGFTTGIGCGLQGEEVAKRGKQGGREQGVYGWGWGRWGETKPREVRGGGGNETQTVWLQKKQYKCRVKTCHGHSCSYMVQSHWESYLNPGGIVHHTHSSTHYYRWTHHQKSHNDNIIIKQYSDCTIIDVILHLQVYLAHTTCLESLDQSVLRVCKQNTSPPFFPACSYQWKLVST